MTDIATLLISDPDLFVDNQSHRTLCQVAQQSISSSPFPAILRDHRNIHAHRANMKMNVVVRRFTPTRLFLSTISSFDC